MPTSVKPRTQEEEAAYQQRLREASLQRRYERVYDEWVGQCARKSNAELIVDVDKFLVHLAGDTTLDRESVAPSSDGMAVVPVVDDEFEVGIRARLDVFSRFLGFDVRERQTEAVAAHQERERALLEAKLAEPTLGEAFGVSCPAIAVRSMTLQGSRIERGERVDLAAYRWAPGKLRRMFTTAGAGAGSRWFVPVPGEQAEIDRAFAANEGLAVDAVSELPSTDDPKAREREQARLRKRKQRARERDAEVGT